MKDPYLLLWGAIFSVIGLCFFLYGKKKKKDLLFYTGASLFIYPYFVSNVIAMILVGMLLLSFPYFYKQLTQK